VEVQKEFYSFHMHGLTTWIDRSLEIKFCFGLVCKVVLEVQRSSLLFTYISAPCVRKTKGSFLFFNFINLFHEVVAFLSCHFVLLCFLILVHCAMERQESCMFCANRLCLLHGNLQNVSHFSLRLRPISELCGQFLC
jgi:hypothetical protein